MDGDGIIKICDALGLLHSNVYPGGKKRGPHISISCPLSDGRKFHQNVFDDNMSCSISVVEDGPSLARCHSAACGFKGSLLSLIQYATNVKGRPPHMVEILAFVEKEEKLTLGGVLGRVNRKLKIVSLEGVLETINPDAVDESVLDPFRGSVPRYALDRGLTIGTCKEWDLCYDQKRKRLIFPVRDSRGILVGMTGRDITGKARTKYHNYAGLNKIKYIYGAHLLEPGKPITIVEGPFDACIGWQNLYPLSCVIATLGGGFSDDHVKTIASFNPSAVYTFTDGDTAGREMADRIMYCLKDTMTVRKNIRTPLGKDPATLSAEQSIKLFNEAKIVYKYINWRKH